VGVVAVAPDAVGGDCLAELHLQMHL